jgi:hypothetical protein
MSNAKLREHLFKFFRYPYKYLGNPEALASLNYTCSRCGETKNFVDMLNHETCSDCHNSLQGAIESKKVLIEFFDNLHKIGK